MTGGFLTWGSILYRENIVFFIKPSELIAQKNSTSQKSYKVGGYVLKGSIKKRIQGTLEFQISDHIYNLDKNNTITVHYNGVLPNLFGEQQQIVVQGRYINHIFLANIVLSKHDEYYRKK
ncbi:MAG: cytochrome c maturation protein CcmE [Candidatus Puniceispirillum sp.]|nr:cytochrome c maturation protein CcmE [Candidatus Pelagibacter sp.]MBA4283621.1 cytochrome c maturation protein CcmE [Candidatus Puniceispirillum sp.]